MKRFALSMLACSALCTSLPSLAQDWIPLQDGKSLAGWKAAERPESWKVEDGAFVSWRPFPSLLRGQGWQT
jgi:hypothetical protein